MTVNRLLEMIQANFKGAETLAIAFAIFKRGSTDKQNELQELLPINDVRVLSDEVLLITDPERPPITVAWLEARLRELPVECGGFSVEACEPPVVTADGLTIHLDFPIMGTAQFREQGYCLLFHAAQPNQDRVQ